MAKPRLLDLFCGAGGASAGYSRAGFEVVGVDINPQKNYPFEFIQADAMTFPIEGFDAIHASPPCQSYSRALRHLAAPKPMLIDDVRLRIQGAAAWAIENVEGSPLPRSSTIWGQHGVMLCGTSFGLRVYRHRIFETSTPIPNRGCHHTEPAMNPHNQKGRDRIYEEFGRQDPEKPWKKEMGVEWMNKKEGRESIPPVYTEYVGGFLMKAVERG
jgi:DNA (cytosine-5)-methyltransferase 1